MVFVFNNVKPCKYIALKILKAYILGLCSMSNTGGRSPSCRYTLFKKKYACERAEDLLLQK